MKKTISLFMAIVMLFSLSISVFAEEVTVAGGVGTTPVVLNAEPAIFSVTVPTSLPVDVSADGSVEVADSVKIINNSAGPILVEDVEMIGQSDWTLVSFDIDQTTFKVNEKKIGLQLNSTNEKTDENGIYLFDATKWPIMNAKDGADGGLDEYEFTYDAILAPQANEITDAVVANVVFTVAWND
jgi:hypothetical protein